MRPRLHDALRQAGEAGIAFQILAQTVCIQGATEAPFIQAFDRVESQ